MAKGTRQIMHCDWIFSFFLTRVCAKKKPVLQKCKTGFNSPNDFTSQLVNFIKYPNNPLSASS